MLDLYFRHKFDFDSAPVRHYFDELPYNTRAMLPPIKITFEHTEKTKNKEIGNATGAAWDLGYSRSDERAFKIAISKKLVAEGALEVLWHELTHVVQMATGRLRQEFAGVQYTEDGSEQKVWHTYWKGKLYEIPDPMSYNEYLLLPWEAEAREAADFMMGEHFNAKFGRKYYNHQMRLLWNAYGLGEKSQAGSVEQKSSALL